MNEPVDSARLLIVDDHPVVLSGLKLLFSGDPRFVICGEATDAAAARREAERLTPDLIVTDLVMGGEDGIALIEDLATIAPAASILVYSSHDEAIWSRHSLRAGARGYVSKAQPLEAVAVALEAIVAGGLHIAPSPAGRDETRWRANDLASLSVRELQVLTLMGNGRSLQSLGQELGLSVKTVGTYRERIKTKLGLDTVRMLELFAADLATGAMPSA